MNEKQNASQIHATVVFVHSLFRSGSTYFYNKLKRSEYFHIYHEPFHEVMQDISDSWEDFASRKDSFKALLRHEFLSGGYFDEYAHLLPYIKKTFSSKLSFETFFMNDQDESVELKAYINCLVSGAPEGRLPILQCTRTIGRVDWLKTNCPSKHVFLLRNPWDQWYSYKIDNYIAATPQVIYSQPKLPEALNELMASLAIARLPSTDTREKLVYAYEHPIPPDADYCLFFGLWVYAFISARRSCDVFIDMDELSGNIAYREKSIEQLSTVKICHIDFSDINLHRAKFLEREKVFFQIIEDKTLEIFRRQGLHLNILRELRAYLDKQRALSFISGEDANQIGSSLEDSARARELLLSSEKVNAQLTNNLCHAVSQSKAAVESQRLEITKLTQDVAAANHLLEEKDQLLGEINVAAVARETDLLDLKQNIDALDRTLDEKGQLLAELTVTVSARENDLNSANQTITTLKLLLDERDKHLADLSVTASARENELLSLNDILATLSRLLEEKDQLLAELIAKASVRDNELNSANQNIITLNRSLEENSRLLVELKATVSAREAERDHLNLEVDALNGLLAEKDELHAELNITLSTREAQLNDLSSIHRELERRIQVLENTANEHVRLLTAASESNAKLEIDTKNLTHALAERDSRILELNEETVRRGEWALRLNAELNREKACLLNITQSNSWRLTLPFREARRWVNHPTRQMRIYIKAGLRKIKKIYQVFPVSSQTKLKHRNWLATHYPSVLISSGTPWSTIPAEPARLKSGSDACAASKYTPNSSIVFNDLSSPIVSVIIPVYGKLDYTLQCLDSIQNSRPKINVEIIVVDDCSIDNTVSVLLNDDRVKLVKNKQNSGFIRSCNAGAATSGGEYLLFLNNDTEVQPGWMESLLRTFDEFPGTGLAGSKLIYPDGRLQEAGGIIWRDGSAWNFGRLQDPNLPIYNYAREVDYCSGASIMVPKALFDHLGGFDEHYLPAYGEDADFALKIRELGHRVIYQPMSCVIHHEGITSGTDTSCGVKSYQIENAKKLFDRWKHLLANHQESGHDVDSAKDRKAKHRVLVIDHCTPTPNQDAGSITVFNLLLLLREMEFQITFIPEDNFLYMPGYTTALQGNGIEVLYAPYFVSVEQHLRESGARYDLAFLFRPGVVERHLSNIRKYCTKAKVLYHTVDLHYLRMSREAELLSDQTKQRAADEMKARELWAIESTDAAIVHSTAELELLRADLPTASLHVFPLIMDIRGTKVSFKDRQHIAFVGGYQHTPNIDAVEYFAKDIFPLIQERIPGIKFFAVGSNPPPRIQQLASEDVVITGFVADLNAFFDHIRVSVAPLRYGAGIKGKIGSAMAVGLPVVATSLATEGMSLEHGSTVLVADDPCAFASLVIELYTDATLWDKLSVQSLEFAEVNWGAPAAWMTLASILTALGITTIRGKHSLSLWKH